MKHSSYINLLTWSCCYIDTKWRYTTNYLKDTPSFYKPIELITAKWSDIDFTNNQWKYFATKTKTEQIVLSSQVVDG